MSITSQQRADELLRIWQANRHLPPAQRAMIVGRPWQEVVEEWRAARQDIFDNTSKISEENTERWSRLSSAEHALMSMARALSAVSPAEGK